MTEPANGAVTYTRTDDGSEGLTSYRVFVDGTDRGEVWQKRVGSGHGRGFLTAAGRQRSDHGEGATIWDHDRNSDGEEFRSRKAATDNLLSIAREPGSSSDV
jgi:hypothetical protein